MSDTELNKEDQVIENNAEAVVEDASSNQATIAGNETVSKSDLLAKLVAYASKMSTDTLAQAVETVSKSNDEIYNANKAAQNAVGDNSNKNMASIKSSGAHADAMQSVKEDLDVVFGGSEELSEDFKTKISTIFEAAVSTRVNLEVTKVQEDFEAKAKSLEEQYAADLEESVNNISAEMVENVDSYLNYAVAEWIQENKLAVEQNIRTDIAESFINGLKAVFTEHYIDIPEDKVDVVESLAAEVEELKSRLNETTEKNIELMKVVTQNEVAEITSSIAEGMTDTQKDKFIKLTEAIDYSDVAEFRKKVAIIKETYFPTKAEVKVTEDQLLNETVEEPAKEPTLDPNMARYVSSISKIVKN